MVGKKNRGRRKPEVLGGHQKCWLWGRHAVLETLRAGRWQPLEVIWDPELLLTEAQAEMIGLATAARIPFSQSGPDEFRKLSGTSDHQGIMAKMPPYPYSDPEETLQNLPPDSNVLVLCGLQDPFNFGSILRSADLFGIQTVIVPIKSQAAVSSHVVRSSVGAVNYLDVVQVDDLSGYCMRLKSAGFRLAAATERGHTAPADADLRSRTVLMIGNEGTGVPSELQELCDLQLAIPQTGHVGSLNAAVAAGILCYEIQRQRSGSAPVV